MTPGTILLDPEFRFKDGTQGKKLFILLTDNRSDKVVVVKTTSNGKRYTRKQGYQEGRFPCFYLPDSSCDLDGDTWIQFNDFFEFNAGELLNKVMSGQIKRICRLPKNITTQVLQCATRSDDISLDQEEAVRKAEIIVMDTPAADWDS